MSGIFSKTRVLFLATANTLLGKGIDLMKPAAVEVYINDLKDAANGLKDEHAVAVDERNTLEQEISANEARVAKLTSDIQTIAPKNGAAPSADVQEAMRKAGAELLGLNKVLPAKKERLEAQRATISQMNKAIGQIDAKVTDMEGQLEFIRSEQATASAQNRAAKAVTSAVDATKAGAGVGSLAASSHRDAVIARSRFDRAMGTLGEANQSQDAEVDALLAQVTGKSSEGQQPQS